MPLLEQVTFIATHLSILACIALLIVIWRKNRYSQLAIAFFSLIATMLIWNVGTLMEAYYRLLYGTTNMLFINISYFGVCFSPIAILFMGLSVSRSGAPLSPAFSALLIVPSVSMTMIFTNPIHHLFFKSYSIYSNQAVYGTYYYFHSAYSYGCIFVGITYLLSFTFRSAGVFSKQTILLFAGILFPLSANILYSFNIINLNYGINSSMFTMASFCFALALFKYDFLGVIPIAVRIIVDIISDGYVLIDGTFNIIDYNKAILNIFPDKPLVHRVTALNDLLLQYYSEDDYKVFLEQYELSVEENRTVLIENYLVDNERDKYFKVEITPIYRRKIHIGTVVLIKDVTQAVRDLETIKDTQAIMIERERLAFLGQMVGGIAHNLKTPILSISGGIEALRDLAVEYRDSVGDMSVTPSDHREIAEEMFSWMDKIKTHCAYISDMITTVKGQAVQFSASEGTSFTIDEFIKRVDLLMKHELKKYRCTLRTNIRVNVNTVVRGDINSLVQIFDNLIINAIHAYEGDTGYIDLNITQNKGNLIFTLSDYGAGIPPSILSRLFKEMVTTKGKNGTGLGLYMSYSTIKGHFNGQMEVSSEEGKGSVFTISIPLRRNSDQAWKPEHKASLKES